MTDKKGKKNHYVDNDKFREALMDYKKLLVTDPDARVPEYIGTCILQIATGFGRKPNFRRYTYLDEMISDAVENCFQYLGNYDSSKSDNPFAYFSQICYFAFIRRIMSEKKQSYLKSKLIDDLSTEVNSYSVQDSDETVYLLDKISEIQTNSTFDGKAFQDMIDKRDAKKKKKPAKEVTPLELVMNDE